MNLEERKRYLEVYMFSVPPSTLMWDLLLDVMLDTILIDLVIFFSSSHRRLEAPEGRHSGYSGKGSYNSARRGRERKTIKIRQKDS